MGNYRAVIVEDERLPRLSLLQKLSMYHPDIEVVDCYDSYETALPGILRHRPDILFLDIQLQGHTSMDLLRELKESIPLPHIIFTTAYSDSEYLLQAIRFAAADYLLKPIDVSDLAQAIRRIRGRDGRKEGIPPSPENDKSPFRTLNGVLYAGKDEIVYVQADGNYSRLVLSDTEEIILERLGMIEAKLGERHFVRAGRSVIVNRNFIFKIDRKRKVCLLRTPAGKEFRIELSAGGLETLEKSL